jgi:flagellar biosynthesis/type III secretory pathway protein FliH
LKAARVVKGGAATTPKGLPASSSLKAARLVKGVVLDAQAEAERCLARAQEQSRRIVADAEARARAQLEDAEKEGLARGLARATAEALQLAQAAARTDAQAVPRAIELARVLTERLLGQALKLDPSLVGDLALGALGEVRAAHAVQFECHPTDITAISEAFARAQIGAHAVTVVPNERLAPCDFRLRMGTGVLDARLGARLDLLCRVLAEGSHA